MIDVVTHDEPEIKVSHCDGYLPGQVFTAVKFKTSLIVEPYVAM